MYLKVKRKLKYNIIIIDYQGVRQSNIAQTLNVSMRIIQQVKNKFKNTSDIESGVRKRDRKSIIDSRIGLVIPSLSNMSNKCINANDDEYCTVIVFDVIEESSEMNEFMIHA